MAIKSEKDLLNLLKPKFTTALAKARDRSAEMVTDRAKAFYASYTPALYDRTEQLVDEKFIQRDPVVPSGSGLETSVHLDVDSLNYTTGKQPSGEQVVSAAVEGKHGALGDGFYYVPGNVKLWDETMQPKGMEFLIEELKAQGIPIK